MKNSPINEYRPIPLPDYVKLPIDEMRRRARVFYDVIRQAAHGS